MLERAPPQHTKACSTCHHLQKMRGQVLVYLLLALLLLAASQLKGSQINVQAIESVHFKLRPRSPMPSSHTRNALPTWVEMKKIHKSPSGPNPVGNHRPPSRQ
ncbi:CLAVATA3/ESR (CLE)-related protein 46 [Durio zibethinus]|uniref:CLAVATA3/ESR (CLE)-related protein 46 n=1 Tax=Durio zibethinus TaxID=66656 RepID=A0A6P5ZT72_DURZI|nr:CLAVATA3/ESR (CLE)-related protein 46 [Durio zibethinus]